MKRTGIRAKLVRAFVIQVAIISLGTVIGIYVTNSIINGVVMREALNAEAEHFWSRYEADPGHALPVDAPQLGLAVRLGLAGQSERAGEGGRV